METTFSELTAAALSDEESRLLEKEARYCSYGDTVHYAEKPKIFQRCRGSYLYDLHGREYLDLQMWYSAVNLGYANAAVANALREQLDTLPQLACQYLHREKIELAAMICESIQRGFGMKGRVQFNVGGSQAIEDALKFARMFEHEYTGAWNPKTARSEFGALFAEAVQGTGGYVIPPKNYFRRLAAVCKAHGILFVDDEIQMGFRRTGKMWAMEHFDVQPDIIVFGKALTNGLNPLSGIWAREELISPAVFGPGSTHSTFSSNTLGTATGLAVMKILEGAGYEAGVMRKGADFLARLKTLKAGHPEIGEVDGLGLALRMEMCEADGFTPSRRLADRMFQVGLEGDLAIEGRRLGLILDIGGYYKNVITLAPSLEITPAEIDLAILALDQVIARAKQS